MNIKAKRISTLLITGLMITSFMACGEKNSDKDGNNSEDIGNTNKSSEEDILMDGDVKLNPPGEFPIVKEGQEPVELSVFVSYQVDNQSEFDSSENTATKWLEDLTNISFDWQIVSKGDRKTQENLLFTTDDYPDLIFGSYWDATTQTTYAENGFIVPITDYFEKEAYFYDKFVKEGLKINDGSVTQAILDSTVMPDGEVYSFYEYKNSYHTKWSSRMWIYEPWLKAVGMDIPKTTDDFYDVLTAFKNKDPNGNGKNDEIALTGCLTGWNANPIEFLMNSFVYYGGASQNYIYVDGGDVVFSPSTDGFKEGLKYLNKLAEENLIISDTWTQDANSLKALTTQEKQLVGVAPGGSIPAFTNAKSGTEGDWTNWKSLAPLKGSEGVQYSKYSPAYPDAKFQITDNCEHVRTAFRLGDCFYDIEVRNNVSLGAEGVAWEYAEDGCVGLDGKQSYLTILPGHGEGKNNAWGGPVHMGCFPGWHTGQTVSVDPKINLESILYSAATEYSKYSATDDMIVPPLVFDDSVSKEVVDAKTSIHQYVETSMIEFITKGNVEDGWDGYLKELENRGLSKLLEIYQKAYEKR